MPIINIEWEGPISVYNAVNRLTQETDIGLYQLYGCHPVFGRDSFLYIGQTLNPFSQRIYQWMRTCDMQEIYNREESIKDASGYFSTVYCGRLAKARDVTPEELELLIDDAEKLLISVCTPPWNSDHIQTCNLHHEDVRIWNSGSCGSLPLEVSARFWLGE